MAEAAPVIRGDLECPLYAWQAGRCRYAPDSARNQQPEQGIGTLGACLQAMTPEARKQLGSPR